MASNFNIFSPWAKLLRCVCLFLLPGYSLLAQKFVYSDNCHKAYQNYLALRLTDARSYLLKEIKEQPGNLMTVFLANYEDFVLLTFNENPEEYERRKPNLKQRIKVLDQGDSGSPYAIFCKAVLYFQWCAIRSKYTDYWDAAWDFRRSHLLFKECKQKFPRFRQVDPFLGMQSAIISTIPKGYKWISSILGMKGEMRSGMNLLSAYVFSSETLFQEEARLYFIYLKNYLNNDPEGAMKLVQSFQLDLKSHFLNAFTASNLALNNKRAAEAKRILSSLNRTKDYMNFPMLDFELGDALMKLLDPTAIKYFEKFLNEYKGHFYVKDACMSLALCYYLQGNLNKASYYKKRITEVGKTESDADKQAQKFSKSGRFPDRDILKARLLNDGGEHQKALDILLVKDTSRIEHFSDRLEWMYRMARVYDDLEKDDLAIPYYNLTITRGKESSEYFAARAALQAGYIYEKKGHKTKAIQYYNEVLNMDDHEFKNSLDQRAKAALNRMKGG
ncbi:MAG: tetratricopeptide repeat protein [Chitinophagaceae bacterium]|nr:tetratricopeptide repeat protein [Chitinophagaceae bacterium]